MVAKKPKKSSNTPLASQRDRPHPHQQRQIHREQFGHIDKEYKEAWRRDSSSQCYQTIK